MLSNLFKYSGLFSFVIAFMLLAFGLSGCAMRTSNHQSPLKVGRIAQTGQMIIPRFIPTTIALKDGKVLVFGGQVNPNVEDLKWGEQRPKQSEIYDPGTGKFSLTGELNLIRVNHTTTLLKDGRVLIAGGMMGLITKDEIEIYDPRTGRFALVGRLKVGRENHQATLLPDGQVLITGGRDLNPKKYRPLGKHQVQFHDTAELFNPKTNQTTLLVSRMHHIRMNHIAVLLKDGRVLIMGGVRLKDPRQPSREVEFYNPKTQSFSNAGELLVPRLGHPAALVLDDGKVLIAGGGSGAEGIASGHPHLSEAELYDPKTNQFTSIQSMNFERDSQLKLLQLENGKVLVINGVLHDPFHPKDELETFDPNTKSFQYIGAYQHARGAIVLPGRKILFVGKVSSQKDSISAELYVY